MITVIDNELITITLNKEKLFKHDFKYLEYYITKHLISKAKSEYYKPYFEELEREKAKAIEEAQKIQKYDVLLPNEDISEHNNKVFEHNEKVFNGELNEPLKKLSKKRKTLF